MVPTARSKRSETDEKGDRSEPGWVRIRKIAEAINNDHPVLAAALPCYMRSNVASAIHSLVES